MRHIEAQLIHDMRNVGTVIRGAAETLESARHTMPEASVDILVGMLVRRSDMLVHLLEDLATVHAIDRGDLAIQLQAVDLADTCRDAVAEHLQQADNEILLDIAPDAVVLGDPVRISQIVDNLVSNAVRYGGPRITLRAWREGSEVHIEVSDDGPGVPAELVDTLFDLYSRGSMSRTLGGSGLGLAIVQQLCLVLGGRIAYDASTRPTFTATLPAVPEVTADLGPDAARAGHSVSFWVEDTTLADAVARYVATGLVSGQAAVIAVTNDHRALVEERLAELGIDVEAVLRTGQFVPLDAQAIHDALIVDGHVDPERYTSIVGKVVADVQGRWRTFRVFGEIVDLYWRDDHAEQAMELEACWNDLRTRVSFPLYCGYELAEDQDRACLCHDEVLVA